MLGGWVHECEWVGGGWVGGCISMGGWMDECG